MNHNYIKQLIDQGVNCIPINSDKTPKKSWKQYQDQKVDKFHQSDFYALICGYSDIECIDIDLKVLPSKKERDDFYLNLCQMIDDNIEFWQKKIVIKKTKNNGYHFIYRAKNIEGNLKLARLNQHAEAIIETRGLGGYVCMYEDVENMDYDKISYISDEEREIIISICRLFNEHEDPKDLIPVPANITKQFKEQPPRENGISPWDDFNQKNSIFDIVGSEFSVVRDTPNKTIIRRNGAKSPHSGYVYKNSGCMYLFSTGTIYDAQKLISPFVAYAIKHYNGDLSKAASSIYSDGYGDRKKPSKDKIKAIKQPVQFNPIEFPIDIFPKELTTYILECNRTLLNSIDYMGCALLWIGSLVIGNSLRLQVKRGWNEISTIWVAIVGGAGLGKSPAINSIIRPLEKINGEERKRYAKHKRDYDNYMGLSKQEKEKTNEITEPQRTQFIVDDVTIEALINLHSQNPNGVGVFKDELAGWFKDMNKYKDGSDKEAWLTSWSGKGISVDRMTRVSDYIPSPILPVLGGIQPLVLSSFFTEENKDSGFLDRMLYSFPDLKIEKYVDEEIDLDLQQYYDDYIVMFYEEMRKIVTYNSTGEIEPHVCKFTDSAKKEWIRIFNDITDKQNSDDTTEVIKSMLSKMKTYIARFALIINTINSVNDGLSLTEITRESLIKAEKLSNYFIAMNEKMLNSNIEAADNKKVISNVKLNSIAEKIEAICKANPNFNKSTIAKELNISRTTLHKYMKQIDTK